MARIGTMGDHEVVVVRVVVRWSSGDEVLRVGLGEKDGKVGCECGVQLWGNEAERGGKVD